MSEIDNTSPETIISSLCSKLPQSAMIYLRDIYDPRSSSESNIFENNIKCARNWTQEKACDELLRYLGAYRIHHRSFPRLVEEDVLQRYVEKNRSQRDIFVIRDGKIG